MAYNTVYYEISDLNSLSKELRSFILQVNSDNKRMLNETIDVNSSWNDRQYNQFRAYMEELSEQIEACSGRLNESNDKLDDLIHRLLMET